MASKDVTALVGIGVTFVISLANFIYSLWSSRRTFFINTVTSSRLKWIDSLRDNVSEFLAVAAQLEGMEPQSMEADRRALLLRRNVLLNQIILHLNPSDPEDQKIAHLVDRIKEITNTQATPSMLSLNLSELRAATATYLKKEWTRVKKESSGDIS